MRVPPGLCLNLWRDKIKKDDGDDTDNGDETDDGGDTDNGHGMPRNCHRKHLCKETCQA